MEKGWLIGVLLDVYISRAGANLDEALPAPVT
jgi:hypothetical protein